MAKSLVERLTFHAAETEQDIDRELMLEAANALVAQYRRATDAEYMKLAYYNMLGPVGLEVADSWTKKGITRVHFDWGPEAFNVSGEERAAWILKINNTVGHPIERIDT